MNTVRDAVLLGTRGATEMHAAFRVRERLEESSSPVDVFGTIVDLGVSLIFRPLDGLLGACVRLADAGAGILVTTRRGLHMQRFTAAHELGHFVLEHEGSLDREIGFPGQTKNRDLKEVAADAFAAEFLMPKWLIKYHAHRHGWTREELTKPVNVYQLSLRMAVSYEATCLGLLAHKILDANAVEALRNVTPKKTKQQILGDIELEDWRAHVWLFDEQDDGATIQAGPQDLFVANMKEHGGAGYLWETRLLEASGFAVVDDLDESGAGDAVGGPSRRRFVLKGPPAGVHRFSLAERRPWATNEAALHTLGLSISTFGPEREGLPRRLRPVLEQPALH